MTRHPARGFQRDPATGRFQCAKPGNACPDCGGCLEVWQAVPAGAGDWDVVLVDVIGPRASAAAAMIETETGNLWGRHWAGRATPVLATPFVDGSLVLVAPFDSPNGGGGSAGCSWPENFPPVAAVLSGPVVPPTDVWLSVFDPEPDTCIGLGPQSLVAGPGLPTYWAVYADYHATFTAAKAAGATRPSGEPLRPPCFATMFRWVPSCATIDPPARPPQLNPEDCDAGDYQFFRRKCGGEAGDSWFVVRKDVYDIRVSQLLPLEPGTEYVYKAGDMCMVPVANPGELTGRVDVTGIFLVDRVLVTEGQCPPLRFSLVGFDLLLGCQPSRRCVEGPGGVLTTETYASYDVELLGGFPGWRVDGFYDPGLLPSSPYGNWPFALPAPLADWRGQVRLRRFPDGDTGCVGTPAVSPLLGASVQAASRHVDGVNGRRVFQVRVWMEAMFYDAVTFSEQVGWAEPCPDEAGGPARARAFDSGWVTVLPHTRFLGRVESSFAHRQGTFEAGELAVVGDHLSIRRGVVAFELC